MSLYQYFIYLSRYSRFNWDLGRRESWDETVTRYFDFFEKHLKKKHDFDLSPYRSELYNPIFNMEVVPSMRALATAGPALERDNIAGYNCSATPVDRITVFDEIMQISLNGCGVGFSVEQKFVDKLPSIADEFYEIEDIINVADSKAGWSKSLRSLIGHLYIGQIPKWDVSKVRPAGSMLKTFGGRAAGPEPLVDLFNFAVTLFKKAAGRKLKPIECHDLICRIGDAVVSGGYRRTALISLSDLGDYEMRNSKTGKWWEFNVHRALANNSAVYTQKPNIRTFMNEWIALYDSKSGERGIVNRKAFKLQAEKTGRRESDHDFLVNPCGVS